MPALKTSPAFTLVELAVVLVIIGLIVIGIVGGGEIIRSATVQNVVTEIQQHRTALRAFSLQYDAVPGDFREAESYWGAGATDNGDGNGRIDSDAETYLAWQHLGFAQLMGGVYTGQPQGASPLMKIGINMPGSAVQMGGYMLGYGTLYGRTDNLLEFGAEHNDVMDGGILKPQELWNIDNKLDDGIPDKGRVMALEGANADVRSCVTGASPREYVHITETPSCALIFWFRN